jgi:hypothetical protein
MSEVTTMSAVDTAIAQAMQVAIVGDVTVIATESTIKNLKDLGYRFSAHVDSDGEFVKYALANIPGFPNKDKIDERLRGEFTAGCMVRYTELHPATHYLVEEDDTFKEVSEPDDVALAEFECSVDYCVSLPKHEFGALKPNKKHIVKEVRDAAKNYCDLRWSRLLKAANEQISQEGKTRASNKLFREWLDGVLADMPKKARLAVKNGDTSAVNPDKLKIAIAFFVEMIDEKKA